MNEEEWLADTELYPMLGLVKDRASTRKFDLLTAACCRHAWHLCRDGAERAYVEEVERRAEGPVVQSPAGNGSANHTWQLSRSYANRAYYFGLAECDPPCTPTWRPWQLPLDRRGTGPQSNTVQLPLDRRGTGPQSNTA
jgi:hypothetical protein